VWFSFHVVNQRESLGSEAIRRGVKERVTLTRQETGNPSGNPGFPILLNTLKRCVVWIRTGKKTGNS
jgi:hypothetical protein